MVMVHQTWKIKIDKMSTNGRFSFPIFRWIYNPRFSKGGELFTDISNCTFVFRKDGVGKGKPGKWTFYSIEGVMGKINEWGWPNPPYIDEVFQTMISLKGKFPMRNMSESRRILREVQTKWEALEGNRLLANGTSIIAPSAPDSHRSRGNSWRQRRSFLKY